ncbi:sensor histidine kinase [Novosphingobium terrae]|uniref:sensor histidine kinase n=1 Tax=Novosphingobium terrae TaxID=2726189 RepID=UPI00197CD230|nr:ATP-binding protein [Novosphingobium terrae]
MVSGADNPAHLAMAALCRLIMLLAVTAILLRCRRMNHAARQSERRYRLLFDSLTIAIWEHDFSPIVAQLARLREEGISDIRRHIETHPDIVIAMRKLVRITDVNATALTMMGFERKEDFFDYLGDFLPEGDKSFAECIIAIDERRPLFHTEAVVIPRDGAPRQITISFGLGPQASLDRVPGSILDISRSKALEGQIQHAREELAEVQRTGALAAMSASIAHELNQPMAVIHNYANAAQRWLARVPPDLEEVQQALQGLTRGVDHARLVMQRVRSLIGEARIDRAEIDLADVLAGTVTLMGREAAESQTRLTLFSSPAEPVMVLGDAILLKQVFANLILNAIQAMESTAPGRRIVTLALDARDGQATVSVCDQGPGWADPGTQQDFDSFFTTKKNGMGLGLSISRTVVERHDGTMRRSRAPGGGARVDVTLPLAVNVVAIPCAAAPGLIPV